MDQRRVRSTPFLPDEIMFNIFLLVPAHILHNVMRYVCRQWYAIIQDSSFLSTHCLYSTNNPLINPKRNSHVRTLEVGECDMKLTEFKSQIPGDVLSTCNGLILMQAHINLRSQSSYLIANPLLNRKLALPPFQFTVPFCGRFCGLAFATSLKVYKVVVVIYSFVAVLGCAILTVGVDKAWRVINTADRNYGNSCPFFSKPITSAGFLYWTSPGCPRILILDVETERLKFVLLPEANEKREGINYFLPKGDSISFWHVDKDFVMDVWVLKDHETGEWVRLFSCFKIELGETNRLYRHWKNSLCPVCWLGNDERILFSFHSFKQLMFVYDLKMRDGFSFSLPDYDGDIVPYISSFAWL